MTQFAAGGTGLIWTWLAFAWVGLPILVGILLLPQALAEDEPTNRAGSQANWPCFLGLLARLRR